MLEAWYRALRSTHGVCLRTNDRDALMQRLYAARRECLDPDLKPLSLVQSPTAPDELWIIKRNDSSQEPRSPGQNNVEC